MCLSNPEAAVSSLQISPLYQPCHIISMIMYLYGSFVTPIKCCQITFTICDCINWLNRLINCFNPYLYFNNYYSGFLLSTLFNFTLQIADEFLQIFICCISLIIPDYLLYCTLHSALCDLSRNKANDIMTGLSN